MPLKTTGKRRVARDTDERRLDNLAEEGDEDARALVAEGKEAKGGKLANVRDGVPKSMAMTMIKSHFGPLVKQWNMLVPPEEHGIGRPSTFNPMMSALALEGLCGAPLFTSESGLSARFNVAWGTWCRWKDDHPEFRAAVELGLKIQHDMLANVGTYDRVNVAGLIMAMKNSAHRWRDKVEHDIGDNMASLIRKAEEERRVVDWTDLGSHGTVQGRVPGSATKQGNDVIDVTVPGAPSDAPREGGAQGGQ